MNKKEAIMDKKMIKIFITVLIVLFSACDKFPLQSNDDFNPQKLDIYQHKTCWEFIESRQDIFQNLKEAIIKCGLKEYYIQTERVYTYLLLNDDAFINYIFQELNVSDIESADVDRLKDILLFHIIKGNYHAYGTLGYDPIHIITCWENANAIMTIKLVDGKSSSAEQDRLVLMDMCGSSIPIYAVTSNLIMDNGPAHVLGRNCVYIK